MLLFASLYEAASWPPQVKLEHNVLAGFTYQVLGTEKTTHHSTKETNPLKQIQILKFWSDFPFSIGKGELRGEEQLATCFSNDTFCNCFYLNTEIRTEGPLRPVTTTSNAALPAAALFELLMCLTTDLHSTLPWTRCFRFSKHICAESHKAWLVKRTHSPPWHSFLLPSSWPVGELLGFKSLLKKQQQSENTENYTGDELCKIILTAHRNGKM